MNAIHLCARLLCTFALLAIAAGAHAQGYPNRAVRLVVADAAGGAPDQLARLIAQKVSETLGQQVIVDNRPGANTIVAAEVTARSAPDGYTLFLTTAATHVNNVLLYRKLPYDAQKSFQLISMATVLPYSFAAHPSLPPDNIKELVAFAKARPGQLSYGSSGMGSSGHLAGVLFDTMTGTKMVHVPYKGAAAAIADVIGGQIPLYLPTMTSVAPYLKNGRLKVLGIATAKRHPTWPDIPTVAEVIPGFDMAPRTWIAAPAGTPESVVTKLRNAIGVILKSKEVQDGFRKQGAITASQDKPADLLAESKLWIEIAKSVGLKPQ